ncbi:hypothetical protein [Streptomyces litchfieldiae]|uniref:Uncharacterized protein n=1 Tax=Streptomyces litchfieldiae TaxID=3075543 RepID=A0ABU2MVY8_9ACTN|nr:hypothetical protein [Streptomyces sp. DSM 44938]MDT0345802.1 hypothetical protein [Streptomyces sp. DSM 44938]
MTRRGAVITQVGTTGVLTALEVDVRTVQRGDQLTIGGQIYTVRDMTTMARGSKRLDFGNGESFTMRATTVLWAARRISLRRRFQR